MPEGLAKHDFDVLTLALVSSLPGRGIAQLG